jgi:hypothetical protein
VAELSLVRLMSEQTADNFTLHADGRSRVISYTDGPYALDIPWEISGSSRYDLLLGTLDLRQWRVPAGQPIPRAKQKDILARLRHWLASQRTRSDIDLPAEPQYSSQRCMWHRCHHTAIPGSAYCAEHFDEALLRS